MADDRMCVSFGPRIKLPLSQVNTPFSIVVFHYLFIFPLRQLFFFTRHAFASVNIKPVVKGHVMVIARRSVPVSCPILDLQNHVTYPGAFAETG